MQTIQYPITHTQVKRRRVTHYTLWDGEMYVTVTQHQGAHGYYSAAMVVERMDSPIEVLAYDGYVGSVHWQHRADKQGMREWIALQLNKLATGTVLAIGTYSEIKV